MRKTRRIALGAFACALVGLAPGAMADVEVIQFFGNEIVDIEGDDFLLVAFAEMVNNTDTNTLTITLSNLSPEHGCNG